MFCNTILAYYMYYSHWPHYIRILLYHWSLISFNSVQYLDTFFLFFFLISSSVKSSFLVSTIPEILHFQMFTGSCLKKIWSQLLSFLPSSFLSLLRNTLLNIHYSPYVTQAQKAYCEKPSTYFHGRCNIGVAFTYFIICAKKLLR